MLVLLFANVTVTIGYNESFYYKLSVYGIPIKPEWFIKKHKSPKKQKTKKKKKQTKKAESPENTPKEQTKKEEKSVFTASLILELLKSAAQNLPRAFRIKLCDFTLILGGEDAAEVAINYGKIYALLSACLGLFENYHGFLYGFRVKRNKIILQPDFTKSRSEFSAKVRISCFVWQLLYAAVRVGIVFIMEIIKNADTNAEEADI